MLALIILVKKIRPHLVGYSLFKAIDKDTKSVWVGIFLKY